MYGSFYDTTQYIYTYMHTCMHTYIHNPYIFQLCCNPCSIPEKLEHDFLLVIIRTILYILWRSIYWLAITRQDRTCRIPDKYFRIGMSNMSCVALLNLFRIMFLWIRRLKRNFLWSKKVDHHAKSKVTWDSIALPLSNGGLCIVDPLIQTSKLLVKMIVTRFWKLLLTKGC